MVQIERSCIVVGAGAAGLSCANVLLSAGVRVTVLEASARVGGRCRTVDLEGGGPQELGATFFHGVQGNPAYELCSSLGLQPRREKKQKGGGDGSRAWVRQKALYLRNDGKQVDLRAVRDATRVVFETVEDAENAPATHDTRSAPSLGVHVRDAFAAARPALLSRHGDAQLLDAAFRAAERMQCAFDGCGDLAEQDSGAAYAAYNDFDGKNVASRADLGGFSRAMEALAAPLRTHDALRLGSAVARVRWDGCAAGAEVVCADGHAVTADAVCLALPLEPLRALAFEPRLPAATREAMGLMALGKVEKIFVVIERVAAVAAATAEAAAEAPEEAVEAAKATSKAPSEATRQVTSKVLSEAAGEVDGMAVSNASVSSEADASEATLPSLNLLWVDGDGGAVDMGGAAWPRGLHALYAAQGEEAAIVADADAGTEADATNAAAAVASDVRTPFVIAVKTTGAPGVSQAAATASAPPTAARRRSTLIGWLTGASAAAVSGRSPAALLSELQAGLQPFFMQPQLAGWRIVACHATSWCVDPWFGGSWSYPPAGAPADAASRLSNTPLVSGGEPRVTFAGEHTSATHFGTVAGAVLSGQREAHRLLATWGLEGNRLELEGAAAGGSASGGGGSGTKEAEDVELS